MTVIALLTLDIHIPHAQSLKDKRMVIRRIKDRLQSKFNVAVSETDHQDLGHARVFVSVLGDEEQRKKTMLGLNSAASYARRSLSQRLHHLRRIPELIFAYDESIESGNRIEQLLDQIKPEDK